MNEQTQPESGTITRNIHSQTRLRNVAAVQLGMRLFNKTLAGNGRRFSDIPEDHVARFLLQSGLESMDDLFEEIGQGRQLASFAVRSMTCRVHSHR